jgi:hypothetical protein
MGSFQGGTDHCEGVSLFLVGLWFLRYGTLSVNTAKSLSAELDGCGLG